MFNFNKGADVYTVDGDNVGQIKRVVMTPSGNKVTHLVIEKGFLFKKDRVVPVDWIVESNDERVVLGSNINEDDLLPYEERHYVQLHEEDYPETYQRNYAVPMFYYGPASSWRTYPPHTSDAGKPYAVETKKNIPDGTVSMEIGADVVSSDGEKVGEVEELFTDPTTDHITHFLISQGWLFEDHKLVPTDWINAVDEETVTLYVNENVLESLPKYEPERA